MQTRMKSAGMAMPPPGMGGGGMGGGGGAGEGAPSPTGTSDSQFEQTFADLAFAHLKDKAPKLLDHMVGFQVIDKDEDTRAVGVFGFEVGNQWLYAPSFFLNGELKGYELLYIKGQDTFVPLEENWVSYILNRKPAVLGEGTAYNQSDLALGQPDLSVFSRSPLTFSKYSSAEQTLSRHFREGKPFDINVCRSWFAISPNGETFQKVAARTELPEVLKHMGKPVVDLLLQSMKQDEKFAESVMRYYDIADLLVDFQKVAAVDTSGKGEIADAPMPIASEQIEKIEVVRVDDPCHIRKKGLSDNEKVQLVKDGIVIRDHRNDTSSVYNLQEPASLFNPSDTGLYEVLVQPKEYRKMIVLCAPYTIGKGVATCCVCIDSETKGWVNGNSKSYYVRKQMEPSEWQKLYDGLPSVSETTEEGTYVIVGPKGEGSIPFTVVKRIGSEDSTDLYVDPRTYVNRSDALAPSPLKSTVDRVDGMKPEITHEYDEIKIRLRRRRKNTNAGCPVPCDDDGYDDGYEFNEYCRHICVADMGEDGTLRNVGNTLMCPDSMKVIKLASKHDDLGYTPATLADIQLALIKEGEVSHVKVWSDGSTFQIQGGREKEAEGISSPLGRLDAIERLVRYHGVAADDAFGMLKESKAGSAEYLVKYAGSLLPGPAGPTVDMNGIQGYDDQLRSQVIEPAFRQLPVQRSYAGNRELYRPLDDSTRQMATEAAQSGQKEVFDTAVLGGLVKQVDLDSTIDRYLGDLIIGLDRVGRILFMFYWHQDKFKERYGQEELRELEDSLKSTFKSVGDVVLFLKKRSVEPDASMQGGDLDGGK